MTERSDMSGQEAWRSLEELARTPEFEELIRHEFPSGAEDWEGGEVSRRRFLQLMGASLALAGLQSCTSQPQEKIVPYVKQPENLVPGKPLFYATSMPLGGYATGLLVESHMGRPTKVEGNPDHPASFGATDVFAQASVLGLYDPDRSQVVTYLGEIRTWSDFLGEIEGRMRALRALGGSGLRLLTETVTSPTLAGQIQSLLRELPNARWHRYDPGARDTARHGALLAFGEPLEVHYDLRRARVIVSLDSDFLTMGPGCLRYARDFADGRRIRRNRQAAMSRLYAIESAPTSTGTLADHRLPLPASEIEVFAVHLAAEVGVIQGGLVPELDSQAARWVAAIARDLTNHRGGGLVVAGDCTSPDIHVLAHAINQTLGNIGSTVLITDPVEPDPVDHQESLTSLVDDLRAGKVETLVILGGNPVFYAPAGLGFGEAMLKARLRIHLGLYPDETAELCHWHLPEGHYLESWGDALAFDGTASIIQPLIEPLYGGKTAIEVVAALAGRSDAAADELVKETWRRRALAGDFDTFWRRSLHDGYVAGSAFPPRAAAVQAGAARVAAYQLGLLVDAARRAREGDVVELNLRLDPTIHDGRFANNGWLQELPKPWSRLTWDNTALMSPRTAERMGVHNGEVVSLHPPEAGAVEAPVWILPGHPDSSVTVHLGYGRRRGGRVAAGAGFDAYPLRRVRSPWLVAGVKLTRTGDRVRLATTQDHFSMEGRALARSGTVTDHERDPEFARKMGHEQHESMYPAVAYPGHAWGMSIDLGACLGCNACVVACQAENNIPVVGKEQVLRGREMQWIRIDRYFTGDSERPEIIQQPLPCMHCEQAPCELVCPVEATVHGSEGLNEMVYNRCIGTRYCSNNCPYKVRRFNFLKYTDTDTPVLKLLRNPDVTVRSRGVMEKCTYCVQRINGARITAEREDRLIRDGEIRTACQQACPTRAIIFGDINDPQSEVSRLKADPLNYSLLAELNTRPRTTYLARVRNPNPELAAQESESGAGRREGA